MNLTRTIKQCPICGRTDDEWDENPYCPELRNGACLVKDVDVMFVAVGAARLSIDEAIEATCEDGKNDLVNAIYAAVDGWTENGESA